MSSREFAKSLIDQIPESKMMYIIAYLQGAALPDEMPNAETRAAIEEVDEMIAGGQGDQLRARMNLESSSSKFSTTRSAQGCAAVTGFSLR